MFVDAAVVQLDRTSRFERENCGFESRQPYHLGSDEDAAPSLNVIVYAAVVQLDRTSRFERENCGFESRQPYHLGPEVLLYWRWLRFSVVS